MKKRKNSSIVLLILGAIVVYIVIAFLIPYEGGTIFERRNFNRYKNAIINKDFDQLQVFTICLDNFEGGEAKFTVESIGSNSNDICLILVQEGLLTSEYLDLIDNDYKKGKTQERIKSILKQSNSAASHHIIENMSVENLSRYTPYRISVSVKKKWYHYFLI